MSCNFQSAPSHYSISSLEHSSIDVMILSEGNTARELLMRLLLVFIIVGR